MLRRFSRLADLLLLAVLSACNTSTAPAIPAQKTAYVGIWQGTDMALEIGADGQVRYARKGSVNKSLDAPLQRFEGDDFVVGVGPLNTRFRVSAPPHQAQGQWRMTVDGVELTRREPATEI
ncbi:hypothetical protein [Niveibacterium sp. SC-1]|uniref:hypothetical protein n=1 Tax=Niveibacterium sp. SC-1 TaxID=3135646 RepID=UPI00311EFEF1